MKKLTKTILSVAAVSALTAAMAASASAMTATYAEGEVNKVVLEGVNGSGASQTMIILNEDAETVTETMVEAIDQKDDNGVFTEVPVNALEDGTYYVRIGGTDGSLQEAEFTVGGTEVETETILVGDVDVNASINTMDVGSLMRYVNSEETRIGQAGTEYTKAEGGKYTVGDVDVNESVNTMDVGSLMRYVNSEETRIGQAGTSITVVK